jgi:hypothetical protein
MHSLDDSNASTSFGKNAKRRLTYGFTLLFTSGAAVLFFYALFTRIADGGGKLAALKGQMLGPYLAAAVSSSDPAPLALLHLNGGAGRVILFVREGCPHCGHLLSQLGRSITREENDRLAVLFVRRPTGAAPFGRAPNAAALDLGRRLAQVMGIHITPVALFVDRQNKIDAIYIGDDPSVGVRIVDYLRVPLAAASGATKAPYSSCDMCLVK